MRPSRTDRLVSCVPSISPERIYCPTCREPTLRKWNACIHCGYTPELTKPKRRPPITRASGPRRDPVTGRISGQVRKRKTVETV
jgi:hypothetical protein